MTEYDARNAKQPVRTYEKPTLVKRGKLQAITAAIASTPAQAPGVQ